MVTIKVGDTIEVITNVLSIITVAKNMIAFTKLKFFLGNEFSEEPG